MITIDVMQDASEIIHYDNSKIPLYIRRGLLSSYPDKRALCHWHEDIELIYIVDGEMNYDVNGKKILLEQGDSILINAKQMHYGYSNHNRDCSFLCIIFHPSLLAGNQYLLENYLTPILESTCMEYLYFAKDAVQGDEIAELLKQIMQMKETGGEGFEFQVLSCLNQLWYLIYHICKEGNLIHQENRQPTDLLIQKKMVSYIYEKYRETISLEDIAASGNVSRSKCCILFKKYLQQSPIDFLNAYRLEVACNLLRNTEETVSNIAISCGFNHLSYFSKMFGQKYNCTPSQFRHNRKALYSP